MKIYETKNINIVIELDEDIDNFYYRDSYNRTNEVDLNRVFEQKLKDMYPEWEIVKVSSEYYDSLKIKLRKEITK